MVKAFSELVENRHDYAADWKERKKGRLFGYLCTYVPEEIIYAAGILPVRILGAQEPQSVSDAHIYPMYCPFCRDCLAQGLLGRYNYLDGIVMARSCMHIMQTFWSWIMNVPISYQYFTGMPSLIAAPRAMEFLVQELVGFKKSLEAWKGSPISNQDLDHAIEVYNTNRRLLRQLYELRRSEPPLISGAEAMEVVLSSMLVDKAEHNRLLAELLKGLPERKNRPESGTRLLVAGSENHDLQLIRSIEELGANIVIEELCTGSRYFWNEVIPGEDRLSAIAARYLSRPVCPNKDVTLEQRRPQHILSLVRDFNVQAAVLLQSKFCTPHEFDIPITTRTLREANIPTYSMEVDIMVDKEWVRRRVESLLEILQIEVA